MKLKIYWRIIFYWCWAWIKKQLNTNRQYFFWELAGFFYFPLKKRTLERCFIATRWSGGKFLTLFLPGCPHGWFSIDFRLGSLIFAVQHCSCVTLVDCRCTHGLSCTFSAGRFSRHQKVYDVIKRTLTSTGVPSIQEAAGTCSEAGKRLDGITLIPWHPCFRIWHLQIPYWLLLIFPLPQSLVVQ